MSTALIIVDPQNDFCQGGALGVRNSGDIFPVINSLRNKQFIDYVFITKDWHPSNHISFAVNHQKEPFTQTIINGEKQMLWPVHCVQNTQGSMISEALEFKESDIIIYKGDEWTEQTYSGFGTKTNPTPLKSKLQELGVETTIIVGLALDYCVGLTAIDAQQAGFETIVIKEGTRSVSTETELKMLNLFLEKGISYRSIQQLDFS